MSGKLKHKNSVCLLLLSLNLVCYSLTRPTSLKIPPSQGTSHMCERGICEHRQACVSAVTHQQILVQISIFERATCYFGKWGPKHKSKHKWSKSQRVSARVSLMSSSAYATEMVSGWSVSRDLRDIWRKKKKGNNNNNLYWEQPPASGLRCFYCAGKP